MTGRPADVEVEVAGDADELARTTAVEALDVLAAAVRDRGVAHLVVTGGSILEAVLAELVAASDAADLDWGKVHVWWGDERYVPSDSDERNDLPARAKALDHLPLEPAHVHPMPASDAGFGDDLDAAADSYAAELAATAPTAPVDGLEVPQLDLVLLGVGPDGHCASLFPDHPGTRVLDATIIAVRNSPKPPPERLSFTFPALGGVDQVWVVASGEGKAEAVGQAVSGAPREQVPSAGARGRSRTVWRLDRDAAARLA